MKIKVIKARIKSQTNKILDLGEAVLKFEDYRFQKTIIINKVEYTIEVHTPHSSNPNFIAKLNRVDRPVFGTYFDKIEILEY